MAKTTIVAEPGVPQITITRWFDAPRELLFRAHTDPELLAQWLGPRSQKMTIDHYDARDGGTWRYTSRGDDDVEHAFHGVFHSLRAPEQIVQTFEYEGWPGHVSLETATFEEQDGGTLLRQNAAYQSVEAHDAMIASGMEYGVNDSMERLDELMTRLVPVS